MKKRLLSAFLMICMLLTMTPTVAFAADGDVAKIGSETYATLNDAIKAAKDGDTIELLSDCTLPSTTFSAGKTIVIDGSSSEYTIDADTAYAWGSEGSLDVHLYGVQRGTDL